LKTKKILLFVIAFSGADQSPSSPSPAMHYAAVCMQVTGDWAGTNKTKEEQGPHGCMMLYRTEMARDNTCERRTFFFLLFVFSFFLYAKQLHVLGGLHAVPQMQQRACMCMERALPHCRLSRYTCAQGRLHRSEVLKLILRGTTGVRNQQTCKQMW
jgi:hypothetical protein